MKKIIAVSIIALIALALVPQVHFAHAQEKSAKQYINLRAEVWNELERMQGQSMIENARRNMQGNGNEGGYYRRSRY